MLKAAARDAASGCRGCWKVERLLRQPAVGAAASGGRRCFDNIGESAPILSRRAQNRFVCTSLSNNVEMSVYLCWLYFYVTLTDFIHTSLWYFVL